MTLLRHTYVRFLALLALPVWFAGWMPSEASAQTPYAAMRRAGVIAADSTQTLLSPDSLTIDSIERANRREMAAMDSAARIDADAIPQDKVQHAVERKQFVPNPTKATWLALVAPGGGQIYNRKYWKLPIFYGGFAGCTYALTWNNRMYKDYSAAYKDAVNGNWSSKSITDLLPANYLRRTSESQVTEVLRKRKDLYRRYRDMSIFAFIGVYLLSVVDAYVDAELSNFDITPDLSMSIEPAVMGTGSQGMGLRDRSVGMQCSFRF